MRYSIIIIIALLSFSATFCIAEDKDDNWDWSSMSTASQNLEEEDGHILLYFYSSRCFWCRKMDRTFEDPDIEELLKGDFYGVRINTGSNRSLTWDGEKLTERQLARSFMVRGTPMTAFVDTSGKPIAKVPGYLDESKLSMILKYVSGYWYQDLTFQEFVVSERSLKGEDG